ncbi:DNA-binding transcriptional regulator, MarR family [Paenibacillus sp. 1_12]|uniref:MarR family winged helix-turn-helix transcriptional regulator n=1 Tax=Paenibacillus sp. 1_12 TaxID=1566278 RepID=UPI0008E7411A|nr:MarR family transcriptional regulator [Paenibacillus sp. 1_12]SFM15169.1 DNA-binding transcriptional regulator, MarR family [Paenibacillus sp. 1_12]
MIEHSLGTIELEMAVLVRRINSVTSDSSRLDRSAYLLLHQLSVEQSSGVKTLANNLQLDISTVSRQTTAMEQKGFVSRIPDPQDGRSYFYQITDLGSKELIEYRQERLDKMKKLLNGWSDEECQNFGDLLKKFNLSLMEQ